jgi:5,5'-dehydrodivanillate O-demethylase
LLTAARNEMLTQVGPGTPMGELLRRYWQPVGGASELDTDPIKPIRLLGEDLVLYRDSGGRYGLIDRHCPHRRADMAYGWVEETGIRCSYHGWLIDEAGRCLEQPYEDTASPKPSKSGCDAKAYPVKECAGLLFAYLGPLPAPELPVWEAFTWPNGFREIVLADVPCNWFQCQENSIDPVHFEWMHDNWPTASAAAMPTPHRSISN